MMTAPTRIRSASGLRVRAERVAVVNMMFPAPKAVTLPAVEVQRPVSALADMGDVMAWIKGNAANDEFAASLARQLGERGRLTDRQVEAVRKAIKRGEERAAAAKAVVTVDMTKIGATMERARARGIEKPSMRLGAFKFKRAGDESKHPGAVYVTEEETGAYLGRIVGGQLIPTTAATAAQKEAIAEVASNPEQAAEAYGQRTGRCAICALKLTATESIDRSIGPICFEKYFG